MALSCQQHWPVCQRQHCDGKAFLTALALGFEVSARIARTAVGLETVRGFHNPGTQGPFGAAAAVGKLYGCDQEVLPMPWDGRLGQRRAARICLERRRYEAPAPGPGQPAWPGECPAGTPRTAWSGNGTGRALRYFHAFSLPPNLDRLLEGLGTDRAIQPPSLKSYATHVTHQAVVQAIQEWEASHAATPGHHRVVSVAGPALWRNGMRYGSRRRYGRAVQPAVYHGMALTRDLANPLVYNDATVCDR